MTSLRLGKKDHTESVRVSRKVTKHGDVHQGDAFSGHWSHQESRDDGVAENPWRNLQGVHESVARKDKK